MKILSPDDYRAQYETLARIDAPNSIEVRMRMAVMFIAVTVAYFGFDMIEPAIWFMCYAGLLFLQYFVTLKLRTTPNRSGFWSLIALNFFIACFFISLPISLWMDGGLIHQTVAIGMSAGAILHSVAHRASMPFYALGDAAANSGFVLFVGYTFFIDLSGWAEQFIVACLFLAMVFYYILALISVFRVRASLREANKKSAEAQKMRAIGNLTRGIAHDFNNILTVVQGNLELIQGEALKSTQVQLIAEAQTATKRAAHLTSHLLAFSQQSTLQKKEINVVEFFDAFEAKVSSLLPENVDFRIDVPRQLPPVRTDAALFEAALRNIVMNATDAMPEGGRLRMAARTVQITTEHWLQKETKLPLGEYVQIMVSDTGKGIPKTVQNRIFDPFFTTKPFGDGSGLGLSMAKGFAEQSDGALVLDSRSKIGSIFSILLPAQN
ncbi:MAG: two-component system sensor histidine kinase NtrB [Planktomarina sp.]